MVNVGGIHFPCRGDGRKGKMVFSLMILLLMLIPAIPRFHDNGAMGDPDMGTIFADRSHESLGETGVVYFSDNGEELVEIPESRSENTKYFQLPDGGKIARIWSKPVHWQDENGNFREYNTTILENDDTAFPWSNEENSIRCGFSSVSVPDRPTVRVEVGSETIMFTPECLKINNIGGGQKITVSASRGEVTGDTIRYPELYPGVDECFRICPDKLKNEYVMNERPNELRRFASDDNAELVIYTKVELPPGIVQVSPMPDEMDGGIYASEICLKVKNDEHGRLIRIPRPVIYDSHVSTDPKMYLNGNRIQSNYHILPIADGGKNGFMIGVKVPLSFLLADTTVYPVFIDPTLEVLQPGAAEGKDNFLIDLNPNDNAGGDNSFQINVENLAFLRPMIRFDLESLPNDIIVEEARFYVKMIGHYQLGGNINTNLYRITHDWVEGTGDYYGGNPTQDGASWNNWDGSQGWNPGGEFDNTPISSVIMNADAWYDFDVTDLVGEWIDGNEQNYGMMLRGLSGTDGWKRFASSDFNIYTERPRLEITYGIEPVIENIHIHPLEGLKGDTIYFNTTCDDPDGNIVDLQWLSDRDGLISGVKKFNISTLSPGIHSISLSLRDDDGYTMESPAGNVTVLDPPPPPVENITVRDTQNDQGGSITISWDHVAIYDLDHYAIYISDSHELENVSNKQPELIVDEVDVYAADITTIRGLPLTDGADYWVGVVAVDDYQNYLSEISVVGPVSPIDNIAPALINSVMAEDTQNDQGGSISLSWSPVPLGVNQQTENYFHHYNIYVSDGEFDTVSGLVPEVDDIEDSTASEYVIRTMDGKALDDMVDYYIAVTAVDAAGNEYENISAYGPVRAMDNIPPSKISDLMATDRPDDQGGVVILEWRANTDPDLHHYNIYVSRDPISSVKSLQPYSSVPASTGTNVIYEVTDLPNNIDTYFAVTAVDGEGNELYSGIGTVKTRATDDLPPPCITSFEANDTPEDNGGSITLSWDPCSASDFAHYLIYGSFLNLQGDIHEEETVLIITVAGNCSVEITELDGEGIRDSIDYYFGIAVEDMNGNVNSIVGFAGPVTALDNIAPEVVNLTHTDTTTFIRTRDNRTGRLAYGNGQHWFNATIDIETFNDEVIVRWLLDGSVIAEGCSMELNVSNVSRGHHTVVVEVEDAPFRTVFGINFTVIEHVVENDVDGKMSVDTHLLFLGLISAAFIVVVALLYFMIIVRPKRKKELGVEKTAEGNVLGRINLRKKVFALGGTAARPRTRKSVDMKDDLYYLQDDLNVQFSLKKLDYKPEEKSPCPMLDLPRTEFSCPRSVVEKCGLVCKQKDELGIEQPKGKEKVGKGTAGKKTVKKKRAGEKGGRVTKGGKKQKELVKKRPRGPKEWKIGEGSEKKGKEGASDPGDGKGSKDSRKKGKEGAGDSKDVSK